MATLLEYIQSSVEAGAAVEVVFLGGVEDIETQIDRGMKGTIYDIRLDWEEDDVWEIFLDFSKYMEHNRLFMKPNWRDRTGEPRLTAEESGNWSNKMSLFIEGNRFDKVMRGEV